MEIARSSSGDAEALEAALAAAEQALREAQERFRSAFEFAPIGMALVALDGTFIDVNPALCTLLGYGEDELRAKTFQDITHPDDLQADLELVRSVAAGEIDHYEMEKRYFTAHGEVVWVLLSVSLVHDKGGEPLHFCSQIVDITERKRMEERLHHLADHDALTGLWNRRRFEQELAQQVARSQRYDEHAALLLLDVDGLKAINDSLGHKAGDDVLRHVATTMRDRLRQSDGLARLGGDEFAVLLPRVSRDAASLVARELQAALALPGRLLVEAGVQVDVSIGLAMIDGSSKSDEAVLVEADREMYAVKTRAKRR